MPDWARAADALARPSSAPTPPTPAWYRTALMREVNVLGQSTVQNHPDPAWHARELEQRQPARVVGRPIYGGAAIASSGLPAAVSEGGRYHASRVGAARAAPLSNCVVEPGHPLYATLVPQLERARRRELASLQARSGQIEPTGDFLERVTELDADWNALAVAVCGTARGIACPDTLGLGPAWIAAFQDQLGRWRNWRDEVRSQFVIWGGSVDELNLHREQLLRFRSEVAQHSPSTSLPPAPTAPATTPIVEAGNRAADAAGSFLEQLAVPVGIAIALVIGVVAFGEMRD